MRIQSVTYKLNTDIKPASKKEFAPKINDYKNLSLNNFYYTDNINFKGEWFDNNYVRKVKDKKYQGENLMNPNKNGKREWYDFSKIGWRFLSTEPLDWKSADETDFYVFIHALSLAETKDSSWPRRFNPTNVKKPLATLHSISSRNVKEPLKKELVERKDYSFAANLKELLNTKRHKSLDIPVFDEKGNLALDCVVFDTETTGTNLFDRSKPLDKIIQIGAIQIKKGEIDPKSGIRQLINPEMPISKGAHEVHHIGDDDVKEAPTMEEYLKPFVDGYLNKRNGIIVAYNSKFDITMLNNAIEEHNKFSSDTIKEKQYYKVLDPFLLIQRIHPYTGARKKLSEQYKFFFCKNLDDAHDAFSDVKGTVNILKYTLYYLNDKRKDKTKPLTLREVLLFQNGYVPDNLDIKLDNQGCRDDVKFDKSYRQVSINVDNYFTGYKLSEKTIDELEEEIGKNNADKLRYGGISPVKISTTPIGENEQNKKTKGMENSFYTLRSNFVKALELLQIEEFEGKTKEEIYEIICKKSEQYINQDSIDIRMKNPNPKDIKEGNDLPVFEISKRVMLEELNGENN